MVPSSEKKPQATNQPSPPDSQNQIWQSIWRKAQSHRDQDYERGLVREHQSKSEKNALFPSFYRNLPQQVLVAKLIKGEREIGTGREKLMVLKCFSAALVKNIICKSRVTVIS